MIANAISETRRILRLSRKPRMDEYTESVKICGAGIVIIGTVGFAIFLLLQLVNKAL
jgi:protein translocase SEC61 complex gamma subunit